MASTRLLAPTASGAQYGKAVRITATASPGNTIHQCSADITTWDQIWLWVVNRNAATQTITVEWGDTAVDNRYTVSVPSNNPPLCIMPGKGLQNNLIVRAFASVANDLSIFCDVYHIEGYWGS